MMLVQWREGQKGKNVHLILSTALKELGLMAWHLNLHAVSRCAAGSCAAKLNWHTARNDEKQTEPKGVVN